MASCESGPPGARFLYQRQILGVSSSARSLEKLASMKATRPRSPRSMASRIFRMPPMRRALWPTVTVIPYFFSRAATSKPSSRVLAMGFCDGGGNRQVLFVGNGEDSARDLTIRKHGLQIRYRLDASGLLERGALFLRTAECGDDFDLFGLRRRAR